MSVESIAAKARRPKEHRNKAKSVNKKKSIRKRKSFRGLSIKSYFQFKE